MLNGNRSVPTTFLQRLKLAFIGVKKLEGQEEEEIDNETNIDYLKL